MKPKKKVSNRYRANLYALTCVACILWFAQAFANFRSHGTLTIPSSIFLLACIAVVVVYSGVEAVVYWMKPTDKEKAENMRRLGASVSQKGHVEQASNKRPRMKQAGQKTLQGR